MQRIKVSRSLGFLPNSAFRRKTLRESFNIRAIIVNHVIFLHPSKLLLAIGIQFLWEQKTRSIGLWFWAARGRPRWPNTSLIAIEVPVRSSKRSFAPICLDKTASCSPVIGIPETRIYFHWLTLRVLHPNRLKVLELSNWRPINIETGKIQTENH